MQPQIQEKLNTFYSEAIEDLKSSECFSAAEQQQLSSPFLLHVSQAYFEAPLRIFFVGQETAGWAGKLQDTFLREDRVRPLLDRYARQMNQPDLSGPFFQKFKLIEKQLGGGIRGSVIWSNLQKMDVQRGPGNTRNSRDYSSHLDAFSKKLIRYEVQLLKPDVIIFGCGPHYDKLIKKYFPEYQTVCVVEPRSLWHFKIGDARCYRTWHPRTSNHGGKELVSAYYDRIIDDVRQSQA